MTQTLMSAMPTTKVTMPSSSASKSGAEMMLTSSVYHAAPQNVRICQRKCESIQVPTASLRRM